MAARRGVVAPLPVSMGPAADAREDIAAIAARVQRELADLRGMLSMLAFVADRVGRPVLVVVQGRRYTA